MRYVLAAESPCARVSITVIDEEYQTPQQPAVEVAVPPQRHDVKNSSLMRLWAQRIRGSLNI